VAQADNMFNLWQAEQQQPACPVAAGFKRDGHAQTSIQLF